MSERSVIHEDFTLERVYPVSADRVFAAWSDQAAKARWFAGVAAVYEQDFRVGGRELASGKGSEGEALAFESVFHDIVDGERIVFTSSLTVHGTELATVSLTSVQLHAEEGGTRLVLTHQGTFLDGHERPEWRLQGTGDQLDALGTELGVTAQRG